MKNNLIVSDDRTVIDTKIQSIVDSIKEINEIVKIDMTENSITYLLEELNSYSLFSNPKVVICYNCTFIEGDSNKELKFLDKYLQQESFNYLIMVAKSISIKKEVASIIKNVKVDTDIISREELIKTNLGSYKMDKNTISYFIKSCLDNSSKIIKELEKLKIYKIEEKLITIADIDDVVIKEFDDNVFDLVNAIAKRDREKMFSLYNRLITREKDHINIIASISSQIRLLYSVKALVGISDEEASEILKVKPRAVSIARNNAGNFSEKKLLNLLSSLADMDYKMKSGSYDDSLMFEMFLMSI